MRPFLVLFVTLTFVFRGSCQDTGWATYGGDPGGQRYSQARQITRENVEHLQKAWEYHTHALDKTVPGINAAAFETTPVLFRGLLYLSTPFDKIIALDPITGKERWSFEPKMSPLRERDITTSRGVATWGGDGNGPCGTRILIATNDTQLVAVDAQSGKPCEDFGVHGAIDVRAGLTGWDRDFHFTSAPTVVGDVVVVGSSMPDNQTVQMPMGSVYAFDTRTGRRLWEWKPMTFNSKTLVTGAANTWSTIAADPAAGLIFLPTGSPSPDFYGGLRPGDDRDANSLVALDVKTGRKVWSFQVVHHDLWDYDIASEPLLFDWHRLPAVAVTTKTGMVFVLDRRTGQPLVHVEEKAVPQTHVPGERVSRTQPFSSMPTLSPLTMAGDRTSQSRDPADELLCRNQLSKLTYAGIYTPPSIRGSLEFPGPIGGVNWGSAAYDPSTGLLYANTNNVPYFVQLIRSRTRGEMMTMVFFAATPSLILFAWIAFLGLAVAIERRRKRAPIFIAVGIGLLGMVAFGFGIVERYDVAQEAEQAKRSTSGDAKGAIQIALHPGEDHSPQMGAPYSVYLHPITDSKGQPCSSEPWGTVKAIDLQTGQSAWEVPHGTMIPGKQTGDLSLGGVIVTAGGLVFSAGTRERLMRAYDSATGKELWQGTLPVAAQSTPMTYQIGGRQFVVIAAGGHGLWGAKQGDSVIAFALPVRGVSLRKTEVRR